MTFHPVLDETAIWALQVIATGLANDPGYLEGAPYPEDVQKLLGGGRGRGREGGIDEATIDGFDVMEEVEALYLDLKSQRADFGVKDAAEKMAYFRVSAALLEKLVNLRERANNVRQIGLFYAEVLDVMGSVLDVGQRERVRERLMGRMGKV